MSARLVVLSTHAEAQKDHVIDKCLQQLREQKKITKLEFAHLHLAIAPLRRLIPNLTIPELVQPTQNVEKKRGWRKLLQKLLPRSSRAQSFERQLQSTSFKEAVGWIRNPDPMIPGFDIRQALRQFYVTRDEDPTGPLADLFFLPGCERKIERYLPTELETGERVLFLILRLFRLQYEANKKHLSITR